MAEWYINYTDNGGNKGHFKVKAPGKLEAREKGIQRARATAAKRGCTVSWVECNLKKTF